MAVKSGVRRSYSGDGLVVLNETTTLLEKPLDRPGVEPGTHRTCPEQWESQHGTKTSLAFFALAAFCWAVNNVATVRLSRWTDMALAQLQ
jgi:hypothetical protein